MINVLLVTRDKRVFSDFYQALAARSDVTTAWAASWQETLKQVSGEKFDLVVADEHLDDMTGLAMVGKLVVQNPLINSALVSHLPHDAFHEASEGLGVMAQLPERPGREDALGLLDRLMIIKGQLMGTG